MTCRAEVNDFDPVGLSNRVNQHNVLRLQVCMNQSQAFQFHQCCSHLMIEHTNVDPGVILTFKTVMRSKILI